MSVGVKAFDISNFFFTSSEREGECVCMYGQECVEKFQWGREREREAFELEKPWVTREEMSWIGETSL